MQLSEAILAGAGLRPQAFGSYFTGTTRSDACSCVIGGIYEVSFPGAALSHDAVVNRCESLCLLYPLIKSKELLYCPECAGETVKHDNLLNILIHLNDDHRWTREQIAEYVKGLEW